MFCSSLYSSKMTQIRYLINGNLHDRIAHLYCYCPRSFFAQCCIRISNCMKSCSSFASTSCLSHNHKLQEIQAVITPEINYVFAHQMQNQRRCAVKRGSPVDCMITVAYWCYKESLKKYFCPCFRWAKANFLIPCL